MVIQEEEEENLIPEKRHTNIIVCSFCCHVFVIAVAIWGAFFVCLFVCLFVRCELSLNKNCEQKQEHRKKKGEKKNSYSISDDATTRLQAKQEPDMIRQKEREKNMI